MRKLLKFTKSCKNANKNEIYLQEIYQSSNQEMFAISLSSCSRYNANFKLDQSVSAIHDSPPYFWDQWGWPPTHTPTSLVSARDNWWTFDFANAFVSPGVNSRGELVPSHGASHRRLGIIHRLLYPGCQRFCIFRLIPSRIYFTRGEENVWWHAIQISLPLVQNLYQAHDWLVIISSHMKWCDWLDKKICL
jgi:hypothetical protein